MVAKSWISPPKLEDDSKYQIKGKHYGKYTLNPIMHNKSFH